MSLFSLPWQIREALNTIKILPSIRKNLQELMEMLDQTSWKVNKLLSDVQTKKQLPEGESYLVEKEIELLKERLAVISPERLKHALHKSLTSSIWSRVTHLRLIYIYAVKAPWLRKWILEEYREVLLDSAEEIALKTPFLVNKNEVAALNSALKNELDLNKFVGRRTDMLLSDLYCSCSDDPRITALVEKEGFPLEALEYPLDFNDILNLDDRAVQLLLREVQSDALILAMKWTSEEIRDKILKNMSQRAAELLREDMESSWPVRLSEVEEEQKGILKIIQRLVDEWQIVVPREGDETDWAE